MFEKGKVYASGSNKYSDRVGVFQKGKVYEGGGGNLYDMQQLIDKTVTNPTEAFRQNAGGNPIPHVNPTKGIAQTEEQPNLLEKVYLDSAKKKQTTGGELNVPEIATMAKFGAEEVKNPKNISQAINFKRELDYKNLAEFEKAVQQAEDFNTVLTAQKTGDNTKKGFFEKFTDDYNTDEKTANVVKGDKDILSGSGIFKYLSANESRIYRYLIAKGDGKGAREYINAKTPVLETRKAVDVASGRKGFKGAVKNTADAFATGIQGGLTNMARMGVAGNIAAGKNMGVLNELLQPNYSEKLFGAIRKQSGDKNKVYGLLLDVANNMGAQVPQIAFGAVGGSGAYLAAMAQQITGGDTTEAINSGYEGMRGIIYGAFDTALEFATEKLLGGIASKIDGRETSRLVKAALGAVDKAVSNKTVAGILAKTITILSSANGEGAEEFFQALIEPVMRNVIYGESNQYTKETFGEAVRAYLVGAISGGLMGAPYAGNNLVNTRLDIAGEFIKENSGVGSVLSLSEVVGNNSELYSQIKSEYEAGRDISNAELAALYMQSEEMFVNPTEETLKHFAERNVEAVIAEAKKTNTATAENTDLQSTAKAEDHSEVLHEPETMDIAEKYDFYDTVNAKLSGKPAKTSQQRHIERVSNTVGLNVSWNEKVSRGKYIPSERRIVLNPNLKTSEMYNFVFKHEFTHSLETKKGYDGFKDYVFKNSSLFEQWARERLEKSGFDSNGSREEIIKRLTQAEFESYRNSDELSKIMRDRFTMQNAEAEVLADFVGENLLGTGDRLDMTIAELERIKARNPGIIQRIRDFIRDMINRFKGNKKFGSLVNDLEYLNSRLEKVMRSKDKKTSDNQTEKYSLAGERARTSNNSLLEIAKRRIENGEDGETVRQETGWFKGYDGKWRFEINDKMSELVENPKLETHGNDEDGLYQTARLADVLKHDDLFKAYPELKDYKVIIQETNTGVEGSFFPKRKEIVLSRNLFERITKEYYDYLNGGRKAEIAKIEQTPEYKEYSKYYDNPELANIDPEEWLKLEKEARDKFFSSELGKRYYQLNWGKVDIRKYEPGWSKGAKAVLFHEIQHAIQNIEGFASGSNITNWQSKINSAESEYRRAEKEYEKRYDGLVDVLVRYGFSDEKFENIDLTTESGVKEAKKYLEEVGAPNGALELADVLIEYANDRNNSFGKYLKLKNRSASDLYDSTAGEIESRDVEKRLNYSAEQRKNTRPDIDRKDVVFADGSTGISLSQDISKYPYNMQTVIKEYISSADKSVEDFINAFNTNKRFDRHKISNVTENQVADIKRLIGIDVSGYTNSINTNAIRHIEKRHGKNGIADSSMSNILDIARIGYVLENYDNVEIAKKGMDEVNSSEFRNAKNEPAPMIVFSKRINGTYYVAQAIPDSEYKKLWVVSAYINKKEAGTQALNPENKTPVGKSLVSSASNINVPQNGSDVNTNISENTQNDTEEHSIAALPVDELLDLYDKGEISRDEYLVATDTHSKHLAMQYIKKWDKETGNILQNKNKLEEERAKAVEAEREAQAEKKDRQSNINNIRRTVRKIDHALRANAHSKHIPEAYRKAATEFCKIFVDNDQATFTHKELADIRAYYNELKGKAENAEAPQYDPMVDEWLQALLETVDGKKLTELDTDELFIVKNLTDAFNYQLDHEAEVFLENKKVTYTEIGNAAVEDLSKIKTVFFGKAWNNKDLEKWRGFLYEGNMTPAYFMKRMGPTFEKIYNMLVEGQGRWARNMQASKEFVTGRMEAYEYDKWKNKTIEFHTESGRTLTLSVNQALQLLATAQREQSNNGQTSKHLCLGGVVIDTEVLKTALKKNEKVDKIKGKDAAETLKKQNDEINEILDSLRARAVQITFEDVKVVESLLTEQQKGYMKDMVDYLSTQCAAWGNEVTMKLYGYRQFLETNYFPYISSDVFLAKDPARADNTILKSASFTKSLQKNASNPLMLSSFTDVALQHIESMCNYNAVTVPLDTLNKMFNYQVKGADGQAITSVKSEITNKFGNEAVKYMQNFITDLNTGIRGDQRDSILNSLSSKFKKSAVLANLSVVLQQPSAIFRGLMDIDGKYYLKASKHYSKNNYEECKRYAEVAIIKEMGRFDTGIGVKNTSWLSDESTFQEKLDDKLGAAAGKADEVAWSFLWSAVKAEVADTTDLKVGSDEFLTKAGERFTQLVNKTQVYDSILVKSQNMRSKGLLGTITSFAAEPTLAVNMLMDSYIDFKSGKVSGKKLARTVMSLLVTSIVNSALKSLVTAARDDDEDKSYIEKYLGDLVSNSLGELSLFAKIPYLRDLKSLYDGYDIERQDTAVFADLIEAIKATGSESKTPMEKIRKLAEAAANIFGVPLKNVLRDAEAIARTLWNFAFDDITDENGKKKPVFHFGEETTADGIKVSMLEGISENNILKPWHIDFFDYSKSGEYDRMAKALERGDEKTYQKSYNRLTKDGAEDSDIRTGVLKQFKDDKSVKKQADGYLKELKKSGTYKSLSADDKEKLGKDIRTALAKEKMVNAQEHKPTEYERLYNLFCTDKAGYKALRAEMLKSGKTEKQIKDGFEIAQYAYLQSIGIDLHKYLLYKLSASAKYADTDGSGGVSKTEKKEALNNMDIDENTRRQISQYLLENNY